MLTGWVQEDGAMNLALQATPFVMALLLFELPYGHPLYWSLEKRKRAISNVRMLCQKIEGCRIRLTKWILVRTSVAYLKCPITYEMAVATVLVIVTVLPLWRRVCWSPSLVGSWTVGAPDVLLPMEPTEVCKRSERDNGLPAAGGLAAICEASADDCRVPAGL
jgi:hypothetical protein